MEYDRWVGRGEVSRQQCERLSALKQEPLPITLLAIAIRCTGVATGEGTPLLVQIFDCVRSRICRALESFIDIGFWL